MPKSANPEADAGEGSYVSPPCVMREIDPVYGGMAPDPVTACDGARWRKAEREEQARLIARDLDSLMPRSPSTVVSLYWPFRGEPDLRPWMRAACEAGLRTALPVVVTKAQSLEFREWTPDCRLERGIWNIPYPADGAVVVLTVLIAPLVGFDAACYRLGYGGGFFDRILAAMTSKPLVIGVGHPAQSIATIYPQPHDIPMGWIVTGLAAPVRVGGA
jgi:5,10-methenyltetrahydrofolate synthetase